MADEDHLKLLKQGAKAWNEWRISNLQVEIYLHGADLREADLSGANLSGANLRGAYLFGAKLSGANLRDANLRDANLIETNLIETNLTKADLIGANLTKAYLRGAKLSGAYLRDAKLSGADLSGANLSGAKLSGADLSGANLSSAILVSTDFTKANLSGCRIYGISAWNVRLEGATQTNLDISETNSGLTVDNLEVAQFIYTLIHNEKIRDVIQTIGRKAVLILGRFTPERKTILEALRNALRGHDKLPIVFDFANADNRNLTETVRTLAYMSRFIIADITEASSIPQELQAIVPSLPSVPVQPILLASERTFGMFSDFRDYPWVLDLHRYDSVEHLLETLDEKIIAPAEGKAREIEERRRRLM